MNLCPTTHFIFVLTRSSVRLSSPFPGLQ